MHLEKRYVQRLQSRLRVAVLSKRGARVELSRGRITTTTWTQKETHPDTDEADALCGAVGEADGFVAEGEDGAVGGLDLNADAHHLPGTARCRQQFGALTQAPVRHMSVGRTL